jgi:hypothetical protein
VYRAVAVTMKRVAVIQSSYIPWKGYFDIIHDVDTFVFYDDVQYTVRDWRTRNRIKTANGVRWLTIPAGGDRNRLICDVRLPSDGWPRQHWQTISQAYRKAPFFARYRDALEEIYLGRAWDWLSEFNQHLTCVIATRFLGIQCEFIDSRSFDAQGKKLERMLDVLRKVGATTYVSGPSARSYLDSDAFDAAGIKLVYKSYAGYPEYPQLYPPFEHAVSVLDLLFMTGDKAPDHIWGSKRDSEAKEAA